MPEELSISSSRSTTGAFISYAACRWTKMCRHESVSLITYFISPLEIGCNDSHQTMDDSNEYFLPE